MSTSKPPTREYTEVDARLVRRTLVLAEILREHLGQMQDELWSVGSALLCAHDILQTLDECNALLPDDLRLPRHE